MEMRLDMDSIQLMNAVENITGANIRDCVLKDGCVYVVAEENHAQIVIGRGGRMIKNLERKLGKPIKVFEHSNDAESFIRNLIPKANGVEINGEGDDAVVNVKVNRSDRSLVIGRDGRNLNVVREILERNSGIKSLNIR